MKRVALATVIFSAVALTAFAQQSFRVTGRVLSEDTGDPLPNARVTAVSTGPRPPNVAAVLTDRDGRFSLSVPATGRAWVSASKSSFGHRESDPIAKDSTVELRLPHAVVIAGHVADRYGDPAPGVRVAVERASSSDSRVIVARGDTDDRGDYRIASLPAGSYMVNLTTVGEMERRVIGPNQIAVMPSMHQIYYPGADSAKEAATITLHPGEEQPSVDFVLPPGQSGIGFGIQMAPLVNPPEAVAQWTGVIRGRVVANDGRSVPRAEVRTVAGAPLTPPGQPRSSGAAPFFPVSTVADDDGRFTIAPLPAGVFRITARKAGYSMRGEDIYSFSAAGPAVNVELRDGEVRERVDVTMARWGSLSGRIVDELGEPLQGVAAQLLQVKYERGRRRLVGVGGPARLTDDLGRYRLYGLAPGRYIVSAAIGDVASSDLPGYTRSYFPGSINASEAQYVTVGLSQDVVGVDFSLARARTATISGRLLDSTGAPTTGGSLKLIPSQRSNAPTSVPAGARLENDGQFAFPNVTPGQYVIHADRGRRNASTEGEFGFLAVSVDGTDISGLVLQTSAGSSIAGRITFDSFQVGKEPAQRQIEITPVPIDADVSPATPASAEIRDDWTFQINGVNGPRRLQMPRAPAEWALKAIRVNGIDVTDRPLAFGKADQSLTDVEVVLTDRITSITATIADDHARPVDGAHLIVFPIDRDRRYPNSRYMRTAVASAEGVAVLNGLPPGSYYAAAVAQLPPDGNDAWQDPAFLESLFARASTFALGEGQKQVLNLKLGDR